MHVIKKKILSRSTVIPFETPTEKKRKVKTKLPGSYFGPAAVAQSKKYIYIDIIPSPKRRNLLLYVSPIIFLISFSFLFFTFFFTNSKVIIG